MRDRLEELNRELSGIEETSLELRSRNRELLNKRRSIEMALIKTYPHRVVDEDPPRMVPYVVTRYSRSGAVRRRDLIDTLDETNELLAPVKRRQRELNAEADSVRREIELLVNPPKPAKLSKRPDPPKQGMLPL